MVLWTAGFVLLTLVINAPLLPMVLRLTGLNKGTHPTLALRGWGHVGFRVKGHTHLEVGLLLFSSSRLGRFSAFRQTVLVYWYAEELATQL